MGKGKEQEVTKKTLQKEAKQVVADETFGLKNKHKSKKVQEYVEQVEKQVQEKVDNTLKSQNPKEQVCTSELLRQKKEEERKQQELAMLRATLKQPEIPDDANPKDFPCIFFEYGCCDKGDKCKFSHGEKPKIMTEEEKLEEKLKKEEEKLDKQKYVTEEMGKLDIYRDMRDQVLEYKAKQKSFKEQKPYDEVLKQLQEENQERTKMQNKSELLCKYFVEACREQQIGFGWICPFEKQMGYCQYRHFLPLDFVLFEKPEDFDQDMDYEALEEEIERKRAAITQGTPVTGESFAKWKDARVERQKREREEAEKEKEERIGLTGKQLFIKGLYKAGGAEDDIVEEEEEEDLNKYLQEYEKTIDQGDASANIEDPQSGAAGNPEEDGSDAPNAAE